jgi:hypothetical protein
VDAFELHRRVVGGCDTTVADFVDSRDPHICMRVAAEPACDARSAVLCLSNSPLNQLEAHSLQLLDRHRQPTSVYQACSRIGVDDRLLRPPSGG